MERPTQKAINFDLDTNLMKEKNLYPDGYRKLGKSFRKYGWEHRQGSGYISQEYLTRAGVVEIMEKIIKENPWLGECVKKCDVTNIGTQFDLLPTIARAAESNAGKSSIGSRQMTSAWGEYMRTPLTESTKVSEGSSVQKKQTSYME